MKAKFFAIFLFILLIGQPAQAQGPIYLPLIFKNSQTMSDWFIVIPEATTNYVLNPSAETTGNFAAEGAATVTRSTTYQHYGLYSYRVQTAGNNEGMNVTLSTLSNNIHYVTMRVRGTLPTTWDWSLDNATFNEPTLLEAIDSNWNLYGFEFLAAQANGSTSLIIEQNGAGSGDFYIDGIQVEQKDDYYTTYCDGTQDGCEWNGATHASTSQRSAQSRSGGRVRDLQEDYSLDVTGMIGTGTAPQNVTVDEYAILPGGELNSIKVQSRVFTLTGVIRGNTWADLHSKKQTLVNIFSKDAYPQTDDGYQPVRLRYTGATVHKQISAHYEGGFEGDFKGTDPYYWQRVAIRLIADDPFWYGYGETAAVLDTNDSATFRYVAGRLRNTGRWDELGPPNAPTTFTGIGGTVEDDVYVYFGGNFTDFDGIANADYIVRYHKQNGTYSAMGTGANGIVNTLTIGSNGTIYAGGSFTLMSGVANTDRIAAWNPATETWSALDTGIDNGSVESLTFGLNGLLYVSGTFTTVSGVAGVNRITAYDPIADSFSALGTGISGGSNIVIALEAGQENVLFAGGNFTTAGGVACGNIAMWNETTSTWSNIGDITDAIFPIVYSIVRLNNLVYVAGFFDTVDGVSVNNIAEYNNTAWSPLSGNGTNGTIFSLSVAPNDVIFAGGDFTEAGSINLADRLAVWNTSTWAHLDINLPGTPNASIFASSFTDPIQKSKYDLFADFNTTGTGNFAGLVTVTNNATTKIYPKIIYTRSGGTSATVETLRDETTGKEILFNYDLLDGETLTIDLAPDKLSVTSSFFGGRTDAVLAGSDFGQWSLLPGDNSVSSFVNTSGGPTIVGYLLWQDAYVSQD